MSEHHPCPVVADNIPKKWQESSAYASPAQTMEETANKNLGDENSSAVHQCYSALCESQPLAKEPASFEVNNVIPNEQVFVPSQSAPQVSSTESSLDVTEPQQCMDAFVEEIKTRMAMFDQLMKTKMQVFDQALSQTNQAVKMLELIMCENHNLKAMKSMEMIKSVEMIEQELLADKDQCEHSEGKGVKEMQIPDLTDQRTSTGNETCQDTLMTKRTSTNLTDLVIDITDDEMSNEMHDIALADSEDEWKDKKGKGPMISSSSVSQKDKGKRLFDSRPPPESTFEAKGILGVTLPKVVKTLFRPTADMDLTLKETQVFAYIFAEGMDLNEVLLTMGDIFVTRKDFYCFVPGRPISAQMIRPVALKLSLMQQYYSRITTWCFPPDFAQEVLEEKDLEYMLEKYARRWTHAFDALKFIYVPIHENGHWFLMVISIDDQTIYHLDSNLHVDMILPRRRAMRRMCNVIHQIVNSAYFGGNIQRQQEYCDWEMTEASGIPNTGNSDSSSVWVVDWLEMDDSFQPNLLIGVCTFAVKEAHVRVKTTIGLLMGPYNLLKRQVEAYALSKRNDFKN
ncbi:hypothetical protein RIF29_26375 [Crotalaria pallida]|uniref:Ubiquitin-like protease family profile domain-containing protein n=1 Tax=Crotalaria pallida TaxID=3830 RepID=A0AAN9I0B4_CROPI